MSERDATRERKRIKSLPCKVLNKVSASLHRSISIPVQSNAERWILCLHMQAHRGCAYLYFYVNKCGMYCDFANIDGELWPLISEHCKTAESCSWTSDALQVKKLNIPDSIEDICFCVIVAAKAITQNNHLMYSTLTNSGLNAELEVSTYA